MNDDTQEIAEEIVPVETTEATENYIGEKGFAYVFETNSKTFFRLTLDIDVANNTAEIVDKKKVSTGIAKHRATSDAKEKLVNHILNIKTL